MVVKRLTSAMRLTNVSAHNWQLHSSVQTNDVKKGVKKNLRTITASPHEKDIMQ